MSLSGAVSLEKDILDLRDNWDERSSFSLRGVGNLSRSDLDTLSLYVEYYEKSGGTSFNGLMDPLGEVKEVLDKYGITVVSYGW